MSLKDEIKNMKSNLILNWDMFLLNDSTMIKCSIITSIETCHKFIVFSMSADIVNSILQLSATITVWEIKIIIRSIWESVLSI